MVDGSGQAEIRGLDIDKLLLGFADEEIVFKRHVKQTTTSAREMRWYQKTSGLIAVTSPAVTANVAELAKPFTYEQTSTRNTSYVRKYMVESPIISEEDIKDSDIDVLAMNVRDLVRRIEADVDVRIYNVITEDQTAVNINTAAATAAWNNSPNIIKDLMNGKTLIRQQGYNPEGAVCAMTPAAHSLMIQYLIDTKGSSIPAFASEKIETGVVMNLLGLNILVSQNVVSGSIAIWIPNTSATWKTFSPLKSALIEEKLIGTTIRVSEEGEAILHDPKSVFLLTGVGA